MVSKKNKTTNKKIPPKESPLTREDFLKTLHKVTKPKSSDQEKSKTSADHRPDDYNETHTH